MKCDYCEEHIHPSELAPGFITGHFHEECAFRMIIGSVRHQRQLCSCFGGTDHDDDEAVLTRRQAAVEAQLEWQQQSALTCEMRRRYLAHLKRKTEL